MRWKGPPDSRVQDIGIGYAGSYTSRMPGQEVRPAGLWPVSRWITERYEGGEAVECYRTFRPGPDAQPV